MEAVFFKSPAAFRKWLEKHHASETELIVGFYKVDSGKINMTWSQSVDEALCFGWIDGIRKSIDSESYCIRFTPRKPGSNWSAVNLKKVEMLTAAGLMQPAGLSIYNNRKVSKSEIYSYENRLEKFPEQYQQIFQAIKPAWQFFERQAPSYKKTMVYWVMSAKTEETKLKRLLRLIAVSESEQKIF